MNFNNTLSKYRKIIDKELNILLNNELKEVSHLSHFTRELYSYCRDYIMSGGKRLRPIALIMAYKGFNGKEDITKKALSVELFHNATLIQDDFMDEDEKRRNKPTVYKKIKDYFLSNYKEKNYNGSLFNRASSRFAVTNATLAGNIIFTMGLSCLDNPETIKVYNNAFKTVNDGQILDIFFEKEAITEKDYFEMIERKTGALIAASLEIGALLANASKEQIKKIKEFGTNITTGFQLWDDVMDLSKEMNKGHELGSDIKKGKKTLIILHALKTLEQNEKDYLLKVLGNENASKEEIEKTIDILNNSINYVKNIAEEKIKKAKEVLAECSLNNEGFDFFNNLADFLVKRKI